jgi:hypothetical protein
VERTLLRHWRWLSLTVMILVRGSGLSQATHSVGRMAGNGAVRQDFFYYFGSFINIIL